MKTYIAVPDIGDDFFHWAVRTMALNHGRITGEAIDISISTIGHTHLGGDVGRDGNIVEIRHDSRLQHDVNLVIKALLCDPTALQGLGERQLISTNAEQAQSLEGAPPKIKEISYGIIQDILRLGPWEFLDRNEKTDHSICGISTGLLSSDAVKMLIAKCASGAALCFLLQHEFSHAILHHTKYNTILRNRLSSSEFRALKNGAGNEDLKLMEILADLNAQDNIFISISSIRSEFMGAPLLYGFDSSLYLASFSGGLGVAILLFLHDALLPDAVIHPSPIERAFWFVKNMLSECANENPGDEGQKLMRLYKKGVFDGMKEAIRLWDRNVQDRKRDPALEQFFEDDTPCFVCNAGASQLVERFQSASQKFNELDQRMESAGLFEGVSFDGMHAPYCRPKDAAAEFSRLLVLLSQARDKALLKRS